MMRALSQFATVAVPRHNVGNVVLSKWSESRSKRIFDCACALPLTVSVLPLMGVLAVIVKLTSHGPVFFRQRRCGKDGKEFELLKFRSMTHLQDSSRQDGSGPKITRAGDLRITKIGRVLRNWKLDELPQLFNVLAGHMSLVGPRPDLPEFLCELNARERHVLKLRPGVTGYATLRFPHEEELLATVPPDRLTEFYTRVLVPRKARLDLEYGKRATLMSDLALLLQTCKSIASSRM